MELATTQSVLMQIQPTISVLPECLPACCSLRLRSLMKLVSRRRNGRVWEVSWPPVDGNSRLLRHVLETKTEKVVTHLASIPFAKVAIVKKIAVKKISGYACHFTGSLCWGDKFDCVTHEQQEHISDNLREFSDYVAIYPPFLFRNFWRIRGQEIHQ